MKINNKINRNRRDENILGSTTSMPRNRLTRTDMTVTHGRELAIIPSQLINIRPKTIIIRRELKRRNSNFSMLLDRILSTMLMSRRPINNFCRFTRTST